jgi:hypothetical protein
MTFISCTLVCLGRSCWPNCGLLPINPLSGSQSLLLVGGSHPLCSTRCVRMQCFTTVQPSHGLCLVYSNSLLATLNLRSRIQNALNEPISLEMPASNTQRNISLRVGKESQGLRRAVPSFASFAFANRVDVDGSAVSNYQSLDVQTHLKSDGNLYSEVSNARLALGCVQDVEYHEADDRACDMQLNYLRPQPARLFECEGFAGLTEITIPLGTHSTFFSANASCSFSVRSLSTITTSSPIMSAAADHVSITSFGPDFL